MSQNKKIKVALIGYGLGGSCFHAPMIAAVESMELSVVLERHRNDSKERFPNATIVRTKEEVLQYEIDLVVITTPNNSHFTYAEFFLNRGKHVVVDKPFVVTSKEADILISLANKKGLLLSVYHNKRYSGDFLTVKELLRQDKLGLIKTFKAFYDRYRAELKGSWKETEVKGAGLVYDLGSHLIDQALVLFGKPLKLKAKIESQRTGMASDDYFELTFFYDQFEVVLGASMLAENPRPIFEVQGDKGTFVKFGADPQESLLRLGKLPVGEEWGREEELSYGYMVSNDGVKEVVPTKQGNFRWYYDGIAKTILDSNVKLEVLPEEARVVIALIELCFESAQKGGIEIDLHNYSK